MKQISVREPSNRLNFDQPRRIDQRLDDDRRGAGARIAEVLGPCCAGGRYILRGERGKW